MTGHEPPPDPLDLENGPPEPSLPTASRGTNPPAGGSAETVENRLVNLEKTIDKLVNQVVAHAEILSEDDGSRVDKPAAWLHTDPPPESLPEWVVWFNEMYAPTQTINAIPKCWADHPGLLAELSTLWWTWRLAFIGRKATAEAAQNWHDRWLPGFQSRMGRWVTKECLLGRHRGTA